jgi:phosphopantothenoylcysteine decarboxylase
MKIVLGVTGSIAAHKAADLASLLTKAKCDVRVVMTADAQHFITPLPFKTLTRNPVVTNLYDEEEGDSGAGVSPASSKVSSRAAAETHGRDARATNWQPTHIRLADEADLILIAPATANVIAKLANGIADDALTCIALALNPKAKILIAPAMNGKMWLHPATQQNVATLKKRGAEFIGPDEGMLSCGYEGVGRLWPVEKIAARALSQLKIKN